MTHESDILFVTDGDLKVQGGAIGEGFSGKVLVHEQLKLEGHGSFGAQFFVENAASNDGLVKKNEIKGDIVITFDGGLANDVFSVMGWRDVRDDS